MRLLINSKKRLATLLGGMTLLALAIGTPFGMLAGYLGGITDLVISRVTAIAVIAACSM